MRRRNFVWIINSLVLCFMAATVCFAQDNKPVYSPPVANTVDQDECRLPAAGMYDFVSFQEFDGRKNVTCVWWNNGGWWEKTGRLYANKDSVIHVKFDKDKLAGVFNNSSSMHEISLFNSSKMSLAAKIGSRDIEVQPYSKIGENRVAIGTTGMSPYKFLSNVEQLQNDLMEVGFILKNEVNIKTNIKKLEQYKNKLIYISKLMSEIFEDPDTSDAFFKVMKVSPTLVVDYNKQLSTLIAAYHDKYDKAAKDDDSKLASIDNSLTKTIEKLEKNYSDLMDKNIVLKVARDNFNKVREIKSEVEVLYDRIYAATAAIKANDDSILNINGKINTIEAKSPKSEADSAELLELKNKVLNIGIDVTKNKELLMKYINDMSKTYEQLKIFIANNKLDTNANVVIPAIDVTALNDINKIASEREKSSKYISIIVHNYEIEYAKYESDAAKTSSELERTKLELKVKRSSSVYKLLVGFYNDTSELISIIGDVVNNEIKNDPIFSTPLSGADEAENRYSKRLDVIKQFWESGIYAKLPNGSTRRISVYKEIFKKLVDAKIDLSKVDARPGDVVVVELLMYKPGSTAPVSVDLAKIYVADYGWKASIVDSFLLVKRTHEKDGQNVSPTNFKGAAGVSLLWSKSPRPGESLEWFHKNASWGINVSYLDFDTSKDFEVGVGPIVGLFGDQVHVGVGLNLSSTGNWSNRFYWYLGFSFAKIAEKMSNGKDKQDNQ